MTRIASFTRLENELTHKVRESMARAESTADVHKFFVYAMLELLNGVLPGGEEALDLVYEDIALTPGETPGYAVSPRLAAYAPFAELCRESDLPAILERFSEVAGKRHQYLGKKPEKTEAKMYHGTGRAAR